MRTSHNGYRVVIYVLCKYIVSAVKIFFEAHSNCMTGIHNDGFLLLFFFFPDQNHKDKSYAQPDFEELCCSANTLEISLLAVINF